MCLYNIFLIMIARIDIQWTSTCKCSVLSLVRTTRIVINSAARRSSLVDGKRPDVWHELLRPLWLVHITYHHCPFRATLSLLIPFPANYQFGTIIGLLLSHYLLLLHCAGGPWFREGGGGVQYVGDLSHTLA